jgi:hypothetical protein
MRTWIVLAALAAPAAAETPKLGVMADLGAPDGASLGLVYRPIRPIRIEAAGGHNAVSPCVRGGVSFVPFAAVVTPSLSADYGRCFEGDANRAARMVTGDASFSSPMLDRVGYDYATARLGFEVGNANGTFFIHGGATRIAATINSAGDSQMSSYVTITTLSARIGFIRYFK